MTIPKMNIWKLNKFRKLASETAQLRKVNFWKQHFETHTSYEHDTSEKGNLQEDNYEKDISEKVETETKTILKRNRSTNQLIGLGSCQQIGPGSG